MKADYFLSRIKLYDVVIDQRLKEREDLKELSTCIGSFDYSKDRVQTSSENDASYVTAIERIMELEEAIDHLIDEYVDFKDNAISMIHELDNAKYVQLLFERYVEYKSLAKIGDRINRSNRQVYRLIQKALTEFQVVLDRKIPKNVEKFEKCP